MHITIKHKNPIPVDAAKELEKDKERQEKKKKDFDTGNIKIEAVNLLNKLNNSERLWVFYHYCVHCGGDSKPCYCWNDE